MDLLVHVSFYCTYCSAFWQFCLLPVCGGLTFDNDGSNVHVAECVKYMHVSTQHLNPNI